MKKILILLAFLLVFIPKISFGQTPSNISFVPIAITTSANGSVDVSGGISTTPTNYTVGLEVAPVNSSSALTYVEIYKESKSPTFKANLIKSITAGKTYYLRQFYYLGTGSKVFDTASPSRFNSTFGTLPTYTGSGSVDSKNQSTITINGYVDGSSTPNLYFLISSKGDFFPTSSLGLKNLELYSLYGIENSGLLSGNVSHNGNTTVYTFTLPSSYPSYFLRIAQLTTDQTKSPVTVNTPITYLTADNASIQVQGQAITFSKATVTISADKKNLEVRGGISLKNTTGYKIGYDVKPDQSFVNGVVGTGNFPTTVDGQFLNSFPLSTLNPGTDYYLRQFYYLPNNGTPVTDTVFYKFNTQYGTNIAQGTTTATGEYTLLSDLGAFNLKKFYDPYSDVCKLPVDKRPTGAFCSFSDFLNYLIKLGIGLAAVMLVLRIMMEGFKYITTDVTGTKASAKANLTDAVVGLLIALTAFIILNTINPRLVNNTLEISQQIFNVGDYGDSNAATNINVSTGKMPAGVICSKSGRGASVSAVANSFVGKVIYFLNGSPKDGTLYSGKDPSALTDGKARLDCSGFVVTVLDCSGYKSGTDFVNSGTADIFKNAEAVDPAKMTDTSINGVALKPGDLLGWTGANYGHVMIYVGNGQLLDSHRAPKGSSNLDHTTTGEIGISNVTGWAKDKIKFIKRIPN